MSGVTFDRLLIVTITSSIKCLSSTCRKVFHDGVLMIKRGSPSPKQDLVMPF
jgi:hypothetical protein